MVAYGRLLVLVPVSSAYVGGGADVGAERGVLGGLVSGFNPSASSDTTTESGLRPPAYILQQIK